MKRILFFTCKAQSSSLRENGKFEGVEDEDSEDMLFDQEDNEDFQSGFNLSVMVP